MAEAGTTPGVPLTEHDGPILIIADAPNRLERRLLQRCLDSMSGADRPAVVAEQVFVDLSAIGSSPSSGDSLSGPLGGDDNMLLAPVRMVWSVPGIEGESGQPAALRHLAFGDPRRPGPLRARWILRRDPQRARCMFGSPATLGELRSRFRVIQQAEPSGRPEAFAAFVARQAALALEIAEWGEIGRRYKVPRFVAEGLRSSPKFAAAVEEVAEETGRPVAMNEIC